MARLLQSIRVTGVDTKAVVAAVLAATFGLFLLLGVGFAGPAELHNVAHDARHASAFPCH
jgi:cobalt transporter subunit CbtB